MNVSLIARRQAAIAEGWLGLVGKTHLANWSGMPSRSRDDFADPAFCLMRKCIEAMVEALDSGVVQEKLAPSMEGFLKLLALQEFSPSQAIQFVFAVRPLLRRELSLEPNSPESLALDDRVDDIALIAMDIYSRCREKVYEARYNQLKKLHYVMVERACRDLAKDEPVVQANTGFGSEPNIANPTGAKP